jgi:hypothetical protein
MGSTYAPSTADCAMVTGTERPSSSMRIITRRPSLQVPIPARSVMSPFSTRSGVPTLIGPSWHTVRRMPGVERIISGGYVDGGPGVPIALPDSAIDWVRGSPGFNANGYR